MIQYYIDELISEGVTYIARFENAQGRPRTKSASEALVGSADQTEEDGDAPTIASSAVEAADVVPLASRAGEFILYYMHLLHLIVCNLLQYQMNVMAAVLKLMSVLLTILDYKLDDEYIHKFLGKLSPKEENQLIQVSCEALSIVSLRNRVADRSGWCIIVV